MQALIARLSYFIDRLSQMDILNEGEMEWMTSD